MSDAVSSRPSYVWQVPGKQPAVSLSPNVIDRLGPAVSEGSHAHNRRALEIGGILLGRTRRKRQAVIVEVDDVEPVECEHAVGASYFLSGTDRRGLEQRLRWLKATSPLDIVGFYRSNTRKEFTLTIEDVDLMSEYFSERSKVFLLIQAQRGESPVAGFVIWEDRKIHSISPYLQFPFRNDLSSQITRPTVAPEREVPTEAPQVPSVAFQWSAELGANVRRLLPPELLPRAAARMRRALQFPGAIAFVSHGLRFVRHTPERFRAKYLGATAALLIVALAGVLERNTVPAVASNQRTAQEANKGDRPLVARVEPTVTAETVSAAEAAPPPPPQNTEALSPDPEPVRKPAVARKEIRERVRMHSERSATFVPPELTAASHAPEMPELPDPPEILAKPATGTALPSPYPDILRAAAPSIDDPFVKVTMTTDPHRGLLRSLPVVGKHARRADLLPPTAIHEPPTNVPAELRRQVTHEVAIDVKLYIDRSGKVEFAELLSKGTGPNRELASVAVFSSRRWEFSPASSGGETVPSEVVLRFLFGSKTR